MAADNPSQKPDSLLALAALLRERMPGGYTVRQPKLHDRLRGITLPFDVGIDLPASATLVFHRDGAAVRIIQSRPSPCASGPAAEEEVSLAAALAELERLGFDTVTLQRIEQLFPESEQGDGR